MELDQGRRRRNSLLAPISQICDVYLVLLFELVEYEFVHSHCCVPLQGDPSGSIVNGTTLGLDWKGRRPKWKAHRKQSQVDGMTPSRFLQLVSGKEALQSAFSQ